MVDLLEKRVPWMSQTAIDEMLKWDMGGKTVFEWGSGGSTLFFLDLGASVVSIEHNRKWYNKMRRIIDKAPCALRSFLYLYEPDETKAEWGISKVNPKRTFSQYAAAALSVMSQRAMARADVVVIDGRARPTCLRLAPRILRRGGVIVLDDAQRPFYQSAIKDMTAGLLPGTTIHKFVSRGPSDHGTMRHTYIWKEP